MALGDGIKVLVDFIGRDIGFSQLADKVDSRLKKMQTTAVDVYNPLMKQINQHPLAYMAMQTGKAVEAQTTSTMGWADTVLTSVRGIFAGTVVQLAGMAIRAIQSVLSWIERTAKSVQELNATAGLIGESATALSALAYAGDLANVSQTELLASMKGWLRNSREIMSNVGGSAEAFRIIGVQAKDARGQLRPLIELLPEIADGLKEFDVASRFQLADAMFGKSAPAILKLITDGGDKLKENMAKAKVFGVAITEATASTGAVIGDQVDTLWAGLKTLGANLLAVFGPIITAVLMAVNGIISIWNQGLQFVAAAMAPVVSAFKWIWDAVGSIAVTIDTTMRKWVPWLAKIADWFTGRKYVVNEMLGRDGPGGKTLTAGQSDLLSANSSNASAASMVGIGDLAKQILVTAASASASLGERTLATLNEQTDYLRQIATNTTGESAAYSE